MADGIVARLLRPRVILPTLAVLLVISVILTPNEQDAASQVLTTHSSGEWGIMGLYRMLDELKLPLRRREVPIRAPLDSDAVYVVLQPVLDPSARDVSTLLDAVRRGAGLIAVAENGPALSDSIGMGRSLRLREPLRAADDSLFGRMTPTSASATGDSTLANFLGDSASGGTTLFPRPSRQGARDFRRYIIGVPRSDSDTTRVFHGDTVTLLLAGDSARPLDAARRHAVIMGRRLGRGRIVVIADPNFLRNDALRRGDGAVLAIRLLEWASGGEWRPIVFDEYHQGYGIHDELAGTVIHGLWTSPAGRAVLQVALAALLLLLGAAVRPIAPVPRSMIERRSPLEHVGALSRAYAAIGATRLAARRLVRGLRRRHPLGATGALDDDGYLALLRERTIGTAGDTALLRRAIETPLPVADLVQAGAAIDHIERTLTS